jgi:MFS family permease
VSREESMPSLSTGRPGPTYKWWVVGMLWFICFFNYADRMAINAVSTVLKKEFHFDNEQFGLIASAFMYVYALSSPLAGQVGDRFPRKLLILGGLFVWSAVTGATALCRSLYQFVFVRATEGLGETFYFPATMSLVADYHTKKTRSLAMGLHQTSVYAGTIGGTTLAGLLAESYGWKSPFMVFGICGIVLGLILAIFLREPARNEAERLFESSSAEQESQPPKAIPIGQFLGELLLTPTALLLILAFFGANSVGLVFMTWMPNYLSENFGMTLAKAAFVSTFYQQIASVVGATLGGALADRARRRLPGGRILTQALGALLGVPFIYYAGRATQSQELIVYLTLIGLAKGIYDANIWASMYDVVHPTRRATMLGLANMIGWFGAGCGTYGFGLATARWNISMGEALSSTAIIYAGVAVLLLFAGIVTARRDVRRSVATPEAAEVIAD